MIGLGAQQPNFSVYIENRPMLDAYQFLQQIQPLVDGDIAEIVNATSNHWRKIFNVYAKLIFSCADFLAMPKFTTWQQLRDEYLLQAQSSLALVFSVPNLDGDGIKIITGHTYAKSLTLGVDFDAMGEDFFVSKKHRLIVSPYFDYRQLSNIKIEKLSSIIRELI